MYVKLLKRFKIDQFFYEIYKNVYYYNNNIFLTGTFTGSRNYLLGQRDTNYKTGNILANLKHM